MYNRYIPQPDGSYRRSNVPDRSAPPPQTTAPVREHMEQKAAQPQKQSAPPFCPKPQNAPPKRPSPRKMEPSEPCSMSITGFLRQLLPRDFDTGDLIVILLLLLMSADSCDEQNNALLTLALYLFM